MMTDASIYNAEPKDNCEPGANCGKIHLVFRCDRCSRLAYQIGGCDGWCTGNDWSDPIRVRGESCAVARQLLKKRVRYEWPS